MTDVVMTLPIESDRVADLFWSYLDRFLRGRHAEAAATVDGVDAPFLVVHTDQGRDGQTKVMRFRTRRAASDFRRGWIYARSGLDDDIG